MRKGMRHSRVQLPVGRNVLDLFTCSPPTVRSENDGVVVDIFKQFKHLQSVDDLYRFNDSEGDVGQQEHLVLHLQRRQLANIATLGPITADKSNPKQYAPRAREMLGHISQRCCAGEPAPVHLAAKFVFAQEQVATQGVDAAPELGTTVARERLQTTHQVMKVAVAAVKNVLVALSKGLVEQEVKIIFSLQAPDQLKRVERVHHNGWQQHFPLLKVGNL
mmetsp:Transcript_38747/g.102482  ORF Transcript_38747/g.102482 Transcript_38747/m.102482 type:complete len:219 (+) Transcript_38747:197-853(+)